MNNLGFFSIKNTTLPICSDILVKDKVGYQTDLHIWLRKPLHLPDGIYKKSFLEAGKRFSEFKMEDYPVMPELEERLNSIVCFSNDLHEAVKYVGKDQIRPIFDYVIFKDNHIFATDANSLYFKPFTFNGTICCHKNVIKKLPKNMYLQIDCYAEWINFKYKDEQIIQKILDPDTQIPDFLAVIPTPIRTFTLPNEVNWKALKLCSTNNLVKVLQQDNYLVFESSNIDENTEHRDIIQIMNDKSESEEKILTAFNIPRLETICGKKPFIKVKYSGNSKGIIINENYLLMPSLIKD